MTSLRQSFPDIHVELVVGVEPQPLPDGLTVTFERPTSGAFRSFVVNRIPVRLIASRAYLGARGWPTGLDDLRAHPLIEWLVPGRTRAGWRTVHGERLGMRPALSTSDVRLVHCATVAGLGIGLAPWHSMVSEPGWDLVEVLPDLFDEDVPPFLVVPDVLSDVPAVRAAMTVIDTVLAAVRR
jgi:DNA-binding transcriptional LysR family regulator